MFDYICTICEANFERPENDYHVYHGCIYCGQDVERAYPCEVCGGLVPDSKYAYRRCERHKEETFNKFVAFLGALSDGELALLEERTDGTHWIDLRRHYAEIIRRAC